jgi:hypothetical protein
MTMKYSIGALALCQQKKEPVTYSTPDVTSTFSDRNTRRALQLLGQKRFSFKLRRYSSFIRNLGKRPNSNQVLSPLLLHLKLCHYYAQKQ